MIFRFPMLWLVSCCMVCFACGSEKNHEVPATELHPPAASPDPALPAAGSVNGDTVNLHGKYVLFFTNSPDGSSAPEGSVRFSEMADRLIDSLSRATGIPGTYTDAGYFRIFGKNNAPMILSAEALNTEAGVLVIDGHQPPKILKGMLPDSSYHRLFSDYFFLAVP